MTTVRISVSSPQGDVEVVQEHADYFAQGHRQDRRAIKHLLERASEMVVSVYELDSIEEKS